MGRAERRRAERSNRLENRKGKIMVSRSDLKEIKEEVSDDVSRRNVNTLMTCYGLALHRVYGFGGLRIMRTLKYIDDLMSDIVDGTHTIDEYKKWLEEETGVTVSI